MRKNLLYRLFSRLRSTLHHVLGVNRGWMPVVLMTVLLVIVPAGLAASPSVRVISFPDDAVHVHFPDVPTDYVSVDYNGHVYQMALMGIVDADGNTLLDFTKEKWQKFTLSDMSVAYVSEDNLVWILYKQRGKQFYNMIRVNKILPAGVKIKAMVANTLEPVASNAVRAGDDFVITTPTDAKIELIDYIPYVQADMTVLNNAVVLHGVDVAVDSDLLDVNVVRMDGFLHPYVDLLIKNEYDHEHNVTVNVTPGMDGMKVLKATRPSLDVYEYNVCAEYNTVTSDTNDMYEPVCVKWETKTAAREVDENVTAEVYGSRISLPPSSTVLLRIYLPKSPYGYNFHIELNGSWATVDGSITTDWQYRRAITIHNPNSTDLTDFQVKLTLDTKSLIDANKMNADCSDMRFAYVEANGDLEAIPYWIESGCDTNETVVWIKVSKILASGDATVYLYYGNANATDASDGSAVFDFFDDFSGTSLDTTKWKIDPNGSGFTGVSVSNGYAVIGGSKAGRIGTINTWTQAVFTVAAYVSSESGGTGLEWEIAPNNLHDDGYWTMFGLQYTDEGSLYKWYDNGLLAEVTRNESLLSEKTISYYYVAGTLQRVVLGSEDVSKTFSQIDDPMHFNVYSAAGYTVYLDWVFVRKYAPTEPTLSMGAEETANQPPILSDSNLFASRVDDFNLSFCGSNSAEGFTDTLEANVAAPLTTSASKYLLIIKRAYNSGTYTVYFNDKQVAVLPSTTASGCGAGWRVDAIELNADDVQPENTVKITVSGDTGYVDFIALAAEQDTNLFAVEDSVLFYGHVTDDFNTIDELNIQLDNAELGENAGINKDANLLVFFSPADSNSHTLTLTDPQGASSEYNTSWSYDDDNPDVNITCSTNWVLLQQEQNDEPVECNIFVSDPNIDHWEAYAGNVSDTNSPTSIDFNVNDYGTWIIEVDAYDKVHHKTVKTYDINVSKVFVDAEHDVQPATVEVSSILAGANTRIQRFIRILLKNTVDVLGTAKPDANVAMHIHNVALGNKTVEGVENNTVAVTYSGPDMYYDLNFDAWTHDVNYIYDVNDIWGYWQNDLTDSSIRYFRVGYDAPFDVNVTWKLEVPEQYDPTQKHSDVYVCSQPDTTDRFTCTGTWNKVTTKSLDENGLVNYVEYDSSAPDLLLKVVVADGAEVKKASFAPVGGAAVVEPTTIDDTPPPKPGIMDTIIAWATYPLARIGPFAITPFAIFIATLLIVLNAAPSKKRGFVR